MENEVLEKIKKLSPSIRTKLESKDFLNKLENFNALYNIKGLFLSLQLILGEIDYSDLKNNLIKNYGLDSYSSEKIAKELVDMIQLTGISLKNIKEIDVTKRNNYSSMDFSISDEKEPQSIKVPDFGEKIDWTIIAKEIISKFNFQDTDSVITRRLENIIIAKLKDIRDDLETLDVLTRSRKIGGMEFSDSQADDLLFLIKNYNFSTLIQDPHSSIIDDKSEQSITSPKIEMEDDLPVVRLPTDLMIKSEQSITSPKIEMEDDLPVVRLPIDLMIKSELVNEKKVEENLSAQQLKENILDVKINKEKNEQELVTKFKFQENEENILENQLSDYKDNSFNGVSPTIVPKPEPFLSSKKLPVVPNFKNSSKPNLDGIKVTKQIMGPIDELETMTLIEFRRFSSDPFKATKKINESIEILSNEGFDRRSEAITAWHRSEVSKFYRLLGHIAMSEGKSIEIVINERLASGKPTLLMNEFEAIMELNKLLRF